MITALLLPLLALGAPARRRSRSVGGDDPAIQIWISNDRRFLPGDRAKVQVRTREDGYLLVLHADPDGHLRVLFPLDPGDDNFVRGGPKYEIRGRGGRESFTVDDRPGPRAPCTPPCPTIRSASTSSCWAITGTTANWRPAALGRPGAGAERPGSPHGGQQLRLRHPDVRRARARRLRLGVRYYSGYYVRLRVLVLVRPLVLRLAYSLSVGLFFGCPYYRRPYYDPFFVGVRSVLRSVLLRPYYYRPYYYRPYYAPAYYPGYGYPYYGYYGSPYYYGNHYYGYYRQSLLRQLRQSVLSGRRWRSLHSVSFPAGGWGVRQLPRPSVREHGLHAAGGARPVSETRARSVASPTRGRLPLLQRSTVAPGSLPGTPVRPVAPRIVRPHARLTRTGDGSKTAWLNRASTRDARASRSR